MKLRNKKTGKVVDLSIFGISLSIRETEQPRAYYSLADLNEEWEDYIPKEPLIKDERIRKAIQAWAKANDDDPRTNLKFDEENVRLSSRTSCIEFDRCPPFDTLEDGATYTIAELCGEDDDD